MIVVLRPFAQVTHTPDGSVQIETWAGNYTRNEFYSYFGPVNITIEPSCDVLLVLAGESNSKMIWEDNNWQISNVDTTCYLYKNNSNENITITNGCSLLKLLDLPDTIAHMGHVSMSTLMKGFEDTE